MHLELLEPGWLDINEILRWQLGSELPKALVSVVDHLRYPVPREHQGWSD
jgi:hypothetical protein